MPCPRHQLGNGRTDNVNMDILGPVIEEAKRKAREAASRNGQQEPGPEHDPPESEPQDQRQVVLTQQAMKQPRAGVPFKRAGHYFVSRNNGTQN